ncbi:hypothetical protein [Mycobacterium basiliense]
MTTRLAWAAGAVLTAAFALLAVGCSSDIVDTPSPEITEIPGC